MALARVVTFDGVDSEHIQKLTSDIEGGERPDNLPATEFLLLHDADAGKAVAIVFFDSEEDYATGDATLGGMDPGDTPGRRVSVGKYEVVTRVTP